MYICFKNMVLAIDQATLTGYAIGLGKVIKDVGTKDFKIKKKDERGWKWSLFEIWLNHIIDKECIDVIIHEAEFGGGNRALIHSSKLVGIIEKVAYERKIELYSVQPKVLKKFATGSGNASKETMINFAQSRYGYGGIDDNEADALHLLHYYFENLDK